MHNDPLDLAPVANGMTPGRAAFEVWYASMARLEVVTPDAWMSMGEHQELWDRVAKAAIDASK